MTADTPTPTPPEPDPHDGPDRTDAPDPADAPTARHDALRTPDPVSPPPDDRPTGLYRSTHDRMLAGVCGGIAERYGIEPVIVRLAFLASLLIGGAGILFYVAAAIVIPNPPADPDRGPVPLGGSTGSNVVGGVLHVLVVLALGFAAFVALIVIGGLSFGSTLFLGPWPVAVVLVLVAVVLALSARRGRTAATLLVLLVVIAAPAAAAVLTGLSVDRSAGERTETPLTRADLGGGYRLGVGELLVDLRKLRLSADETPVKVGARVDLGRVGVVLPADRCVAWTVRTTVGLGGDVRVLDRESNDRWIGSRWRTQIVRIDPGENRPHVTIDAHVGAGEIVVANTLSEARGNRPLSAAAGPRSVIRTDACRKSTSRRP